MEEQQLGRRHRLQLLHLLQLLRHLWRRLQSQEYHPIVIATTRTLGEAAAAAVVVVGGKAVAAAEVVQGAVKPKTEKRAIKRPGGWRSTL